MYLSITASSSTLAFDVVIKNDGNERLTQGTFTYEKKFYEIGTEDREKTNQVHPSCVSIEENARRNNANDRKRYYKNNVHESASVLLNDACANT